MRSCEKYRKFISDDLDGELDSKKTLRLAAHLQKCPSCRVYKKKLIDLQKKAGMLKGPFVVEGYWEDFSARLNAKILDEAQRKQRGFPFLAGWRYAWIGAAVLLVISFGLVAFLVFRPAKGAQEVNFLSFERFLDRIYREIGTDEGLADFFSLAVMDFIAEEVDTVEPVSRLYFPEDPLFVESLGEEELEFVGQEIERETRSRGG